MGRKRGPKIEVPADNTVHSHVDKTTKCRGGLFRTGDGADRISEHMGSIVVRCIECGATFSLPCKKEE